MGNLWCGFCSPLPLPITSTLKYTARLCDKPEMQASFDGLAIELLKHGYQHHLLAAVYCPDDGEFRIGDHHVSDDRYPCPQCGKACHCVVLGRELSRRELPFADFVRHIKPTCYRRPGSRRYGDEDEDDDVETLQLREDWTRWRTYRPGHRTGPVVGGYKRRRKPENQQGSAAPV